MNAFISRWKRIEWWRLWDAIKSILIVIWILGCGVAAFAYAYKTAAQEAAALKTEVFVPYTLSYLPVNAVVYADFANREGGFLTGGGMGSPDGRPYDLNQFNEDTAGQLTTLVLFNLTDKANTYPGKLYVTYWARRADGATVHIEQLVGASPAGATVTGYKMVGTEAVHPELVDGKLLVPFALEDYGGSLVVFGLLAGVVGALAGYGAFWIGSSIFEIGSLLLERHRADQRHRKWLERKKS